MENKNLLTPEITALMTTYNSAHHAWIQLSSATH